MGDTIAAVATPMARGAIGILRLSGPEAVQAASAVFKPASGRPLEAYQGRRLVYGTLYDREGNAIDQVLETNGAERTWDENSGQYYAEYTADGKTYKVWLEEEESIALKASLIKEYNLAGISAWKLGFERQDIWDVILRYVN